MPVRLRFPCGCPTRRLVFCRLTILGACHRYPGCTRVFTMPGALHTHTGWHKRKENISAGVYDRLGHHLKVRIRHICTRVLTSTTPRVPLQHACVHHHSSHECPLAVLTGDPQHGGRARAGHGPRGVSVRLPRVRQVVPKPRGAAHASGVPRLGTPLEPLPYLMSPT